MVMEHSMATTAASRVHLWTKFWAVVDQLKKCENFVVHLNGGTQVMMVAKKCD